MSTTLNGTTGITFPDGSTQATTAPYGMVNRLINGAMSIDQRSAGAAKSCPAATDTYTLDRWIVRPTGNAVSVQKTTSGLSTGCQDALQISGAASVTAVVLSQRIESYNIEDLIGQTVTVSVTMANSLLTSIGWTARYANTVDNFSAMTAISSGSITVNSTMTTYTFSFVVPVNGANGISIEFSAGAQTSGTWKVTQVQLQKGSTATSFDYRPYGTELALCQRYYCKSYNDGVIPGAVSLPGAHMCVYVGSGSSFRHTTPFKVNMRTAPTVTVYNPETGASGYIAAEGGGRTNQASAGVTFVGNFSALVFSTSVPVAGIYYFQYKAEAEL